MQLNATKKNGTINFIIKENTATAKLCATLKHHEPVALMGPTGVRAKISEEHETVLIIGDTSSFGFLRSYGPAMRKNGNRIIYLGQFNQAEDAYCRGQIEHAADVVIYQTKSGDAVRTKRINDYSTKGDSIVKALTDYANGDLGKPAHISLHDIDRVYVVGSSDLLRTFQAARATELKSHLVKDPIVSGSVYGNMQCMLKGVCAQCLQWQIDPETGQRTKAVFACSWQDQPLAIIDIDHLDARMMQNRLHDQISKMWIDHLFANYPVTRV